jgi:3-dehydrotetronate 4-kinase
MKMLFGAIADDFTGGSDLAGMLRERGVATVQTFGVPDEGLLEKLRGRYQAAVVCLKSRSIPADEARAVSLAALGRLQKLEPRQLYFKYCSTFDSTPEGNIGPVADALMGWLGSGFTIALPALPVNGRTQYQGHLFVNGQLLSDSPMRNHPLNPMTDSNLVRWLQLQTERRVGLIPLDVVSGGPERIKERTAELRDSGVAMALVDCVCESDLDRVAEAFVDHRFLTGGSGLGMALPKLWREKGWLSADAIETPGSAGGPVVALSGSCSAATLRQVERLRASGCAVVGIEQGEDELFAAASTALERAGRVAVSSSAPPEQRKLGAAQEIEALMGRLAGRFVNEAGVRRIVVAGGETSGAVVEALGVKAVEITGILDPGVPSLRSIEEPRVALALKSGNFGSEDFFEKAMRQI